MPYMKTILSLTVAAGLGACSAASQKSAEVETVSEPIVQSVSNHAAHKDAPHRATVKPGASVTMNSALPKDMRSGYFQTVQLNFNEAYSGGTMSVTVAPSEGLSLFGGASSKTFDMTNPDTHTWDIDVKADVDGVYFLNVFAEAQGQPRTFSVQLNIGQTTQKMFDDAMPADGKLVNGGKIRVMDAEETIE